MYCIQDMQFPKKRFLEIPKSGIWEGDEAKWERGILNSLH